MSNSVAIVPFILTAASDAKVGTRQSSASVENNLDIFWLSDFFFYGFQLRFIRKI